MKRYALIGLAEDGETEVVLRMRDLDEPEADAEVVPHSVVEIGSVEGAAERAARSGAVDAEAVVKTEIRKGVKPLANGRPSLRPLIDEMPALAWWQMIARQDFDVQADRVVVIHHVAPMPIATARQVKKDEVTALYRSKIAAGFEYPVGSGRFVQIDNESRDNIGNVGQEARAAKRGETSWNSETEWRMLDNKGLPLPTPQHMIDLGEAAKAAFMRIRLTHWAHKDAIDILPTAEAVAAYDIHQGW